MVACRKIFNSIGKFNFLTFLTIIICPLLGFRLFLDWLEQTANCELFFLISTKINENKPWSLPIYRNWLYQVIYQILFKHPNILIYNYYLVRFK